MKISSNVSFLILYLTHILYVKVISTSKSGILE